MALTLILLTCASADAQHRRQRAKKAAEPPAAAATTLEQQLDRLLSAVPKSTRIGVVVADGDSGAVLYAHEPDLALQPASVQKLFVTAAALERFGPEFALETRVYLNGDELWVLGGGDPGLGDERIAALSKHAPGDALANWAATLKARGVKSISRIVLDDSVFDQNYRQPEWPVEQSDRWYQAPVGGLNLNDNCLDVTVALRGKEVELELQPDLPDDCVASSLRLGRAQRPVLKRAAGGDVFEVEGTVRTGGALGPIAVNNPTTFFGAALRQALVNAGIEVRGDVTRATLAADRLAGADLIATEATRVPQLMWRCNTFSQNMFAECLIKALAAYGPDGRRTGTPGNWSAGREVVRATLGKLGVDLSSATLHDGSGLSHENTATAGQFVQLLVRMRKHPHADVFLNSLAAAGEEGSMKNRYGDAAFRGHLRGKTGTIAGVHALAGYLTAANGHVYAFAILVNGPAPGNLTTNICKAILR